MRKIKKYVFVLVVFIFVFTLCFGAYAFSLSSQNCIYMKYDSYKVAEEEGDLAYFKFNMVGKLGNSHDYKGFYTVASPVCKKAFDYVVFYIEKKNDGIVLHSLCLDRNFNILLDDDVVCIIEENYSYLLGTEDKYCEYFNSFWNQSLSSFSGFGHFSFPDGVSIVSSTDPVFLSKDSAINHAKTGSFKDIFNDSYLPYAFDLECPLDLKCELLNRTAGYERFIFNWSQKDENYINWDTEFLFYCDLRYRKQIFGFIGVSDWVNLDDFFVFDKFCSTSNLKYSTELYCQEYDDALNFYFSSIDEDLGGKQIEILGADFYIRNKYVDAASGKTHYSNWVRVHYTSNGDDIEVSYSEIEVDDPNSVGSNGKPSGTLNPDNGYTGEVQQATVNSASGLVDFVKNGFGLLGNNGLISFLKQVLAFVPCEFWEIIIIGVSFFVLIAIIKFARG